MEAVGVNRDEALSYRVDGKQRFLACRQISNGTSQLGRDTRLRSTDDFAASPSAYRSLWLRQWGSPPYGPRTDLPHAEEILGELGNLTHLRLGGSQLTGEIPAGLGRLEHLTLLHLSGNQLTGCVPAALMDVADNDFAQLGLDFCPPAIADRAFSATTLAPGGQTAVTIEADGCGDAGQVLEALPPGFAIVSSSLSGDQVTVTGQQVQEVTFAMTGETSFTYTVAAPGIEGLYTFSGTVTDSKEIDYPVGGDDRVTVSLRDWLLIRYDADDSGTIDISELFSAIDDYFAGGISISQFFALIDLYFAGPAPAAAASGQARTGTS